MLENAELWKMHNIQFHLRCAATVLENAAEDGKVWEVDGGGGSRVLGMDLPTRKALRPITRVYGTS